MSQNVNFTITVISQSFIKLETSSLNQKINKIYPKNNLSFLRSLSAVGSRE